MIMFGSVHQKRVEIKEGQLAEKTIRANKNIENTYETEQRKNWQQKLSHPNIFIKKIRHLSNIIVLINYLN